MDDLRVVGLTLTLVLSTILHTATAVFLYRLSPITLHALPHRVCFSLLNQTLGIFSVLYLKLLA